MRYMTEKEYAVTRPFGVFDAAYSRYPHSKHPGTDFGVPADTPLYAGMSGRVQIYLSSAKTGRGNEAWITDGIYSRRACHMNRVNVRSGQWVEEGQLIGLSGYTGYVLDSRGNVGTPGGAHLHDELLINGEYVDVTKFIGEEMAKPSDKEVRSAALTYGQKFTDAQVKYYTERPWENLLNDLLPAVNAERLALQKQVSASADATAIADAQKWREYMKLIGR